MSLFDDLPIPRLALAQAIARRLEGAPGPKPVHVHGPEGYGKQVVSRALASAASRQARPVASVSAQGADGQSASGFLIDRLIRPLAKAILPETDAPQFRLDREADVGRAVFDALGAVAASRVERARSLFVVDGAEWLWLAEGFHSGFLAAYGEDPDDRPFDLVTLSAFSARALGLDDRLDERALLPLEVAAQGQNPFLAGAAPRSAAGSDDSIAELKAWIESRQQGARRHSALLQVSADDLIPIVRDGIERFGGHPGLSIAAIDRLLHESERNEAAAMPSPVQIFEAQLRSWEEEADRFRGCLFPQLESPETLPEQLCGPAIEMLARLPTQIQADLSETADPTMIDLCIGLGLRRPGTVDERHEDSFPQMRKWVRQDWLDARIDALKARLRDAADRRDRAERVADPHVATVEQEVRRYFCGNDDPDPKGNASGPYRLLDLETRIVEPELQYKLILQREIPEQTEAEAAPERRRRPRRWAIFARETLHVFRDFSAAGEQLWSQHCNMLKRLSGAGNPALPQIYQGGRITSENDGESDEKSMGYLQIEDPGPSLRSRFKTTQRALTEPRRGEDETKPVEAAVRAAELASALALLHAKGYAHRRITLDAIRVSASGDSTTLVLSGFEFALILDMMTLGKRTGTRNIRDDGAMIAGDIPFWSLDQLRVTAEGADDNGFGVITWAETDVHAMCVLICYLLTGALDEKEVAALEAALPRLEPDPRKCEQACKDLSASIRGALLREPRWSAVKRGHTKIYGEFLDQMRRLLGQGLSAPNQRRTLSADDLTRGISASLDEYRRTLAQQRDAKFALYYDVQHMGPNLRKLGFLEEDGRTPESRALLEDKLAEWLEAVSEIRFREEGFFGKGGDARLSTRQAAKYMLISDQVVMFASLHHDQASKRQDPRLLRLSFVVYRSDVHLPQLSDSQKIPFPLNFKVFASDRLDDIPRHEYQTWHRTMRSAREAGRHDGTVASASLHFHRQLLMAQEDLKQFPVKVTFSGGEAYLSLDRIAYQRSKRGNEFISLVLQTGRDDELIFLDTVEAWREAARAGSSRLQFFGKTKQQSVRFDLEVYGTDAGRIVVLNDPQFTPSGQIVFSDLAGASHASLLQEKAIDELIAKRTFFRHLDRPRNDAPVLMPAPLDFEQQYGPATVSVLQNIKSGRPITALQGPPGSGKSTMIALLIADMLQEDETLRFLVTSQSHAAVDVTLEKVVAVTRDVPSHAYCGEAPDAIRLLPGRFVNRVSQHVRDNYATKAVVDRKLDGISKAAEERLASGGLTKKMREAYEALRDAGKRSGFEVWNRIERHAPLVFGTTAASAAARQLGHGDEFDVVIVDEAAKAFGIDIVQPLSIAHHAIMVGDHKQLSPFDYQGSKQLFHKARELYLDRNLEIRVPEEVAVISDERNFDDALSWLTPFARFFDKAIAERPASPRSRRGAIPVAQMLATQHRSFEPIGALVSNTFYDGRVKTAPSLRLDDYHEHLPWLPFIDGRQRAPVILWVDTSNQREPLYEADQSGAGKLFNTGEIGIVRRILPYCDLDRLRDAGLAPGERCKIMSPYAEQVRRLGQALKGDEVMLAEDIKANLDRIVQTIDSSQGAESAIAIVSLTRTGKVAASRLTCDEDYEREMRRSLGFLTDRARMNVMFSRAARQLVIVGKYSLFKGFDALIQDWIKVSPTGERKRQLREAYGFWGRLLGQFQDGDLDATILRVDAERIEGLTG